MNYKHFIMIALVLMLALAVPASAEWANGNWIDSEHSEQYFGTAKVVTDAQTGVTSKYNPITSEIDLMTYQGHVYGNLKSGHVLEGCVILRRVVRIIFEKLAWMNHGLSACTSRQNGYVSGPVRPGFPLTSRSYPAHVCGRKAQLVFASCEYNAYAPDFACATLAQYALFSFVSFRCFFDDWHEFVFQDQKRSIDATDKIVQTIYKLVKRCRFLHHHRTHLKVFMGKIGG